MLATRLTNERVEACSTGSWEGHKIELLVGVTKLFVEAKRVLSLQSADPVSFLLQASFSREGSVDDEPPKRMGSALVVKMVYNMRHRATSGNSAKMFGYASANGVTGLAHVVLKTVGAIKNIYTMGGVAREIG